jgi:hypothetical protein
MGTFSKTTDSLMTTTTIWANHFPNGCPPDESQPSTGVVFRLVAHNPPVGDDFKSHYELSPERDFRNTLCIACGLSIHTDKEDAKKVFYRLCSRVPARRKTNMIASAMLNETMGRLLPTKGNEASHHTWWVALDANPCEKFSILEVLECVSE